MSIDTTRAAPAVPRSQACGAGAAQRLRTLRAAGRLVSSTDPAVVRQTAAQMAADLFFAPLLAEMRRFPLGRELVDGGRTEAIFGEQLDQRIADTVAGAAHGLLDRLVRDFQGHAATPGADTATWAVRQQLDGGPA